MNKIDYKEILMIIISHIQILNDFKFIIVIGIKNIIITTTVVEIITNLLPSLSQDPLS